MSKSIPRLERELSDEIVALRQHLNLLESQVKDLQAAQVQEKLNFLALGRAITDLELHD